MCGSVQFGSFTTWKAHAQRIDRVLPTKRKVHINQFYNNRAYKAHNRLIIGIFEPTVMAVLS